MGLFFRKSLKCGPFRLNFSKSGMGISFGVKGLRISQNSRGTYLHAGRSGLYFREKLDKKTKQSNNLPEELLNSNETVVIRISEELNQYIKKIKKQCLLPFIIGTILTVIIYSVNEDLATGFEAILIMCVLAWYGFLNLLNPDLSKSYKEILELEKDLSKEGIEHVREIGEPEDVEEYNDIDNDIDFIEDLED